MSEKPPLVLTDGAGGPLVVSMDVGSCLDDFGYLNACPPAGGGVTGRSQLPCDCQLSGPDPHGDGMNWTFTRSRNSRSSLRFHETRAASCWLRVVRAQAPFKSVCSLVTLSANMICGEDEVEDDRSQRTSSVQSTECTT